MAMIRKGTGTKQPVNLTKEGARRGNTDQYTRSNKQGKHKLVMLKRISFNRNKWLSSIYTQSKACRSNTQSK